MQRRIPINTDYLKSELKNSGYTAKELSIMFDSQGNYLSRCFADGVIGENTLMKVCLLLKRNPEDFYIKKNIECEEKPSEAVGKSSLESEVEAVNDAIASLVKMTEVIQNNVKRLSDEVSTLKDTEYMAAQEAKRYYQTGNAFFKQLLGFLKNTRG